MLDEPLGGIDRGARAVERHGRTRQSAMSFRL
jgi:hypothetical protein